MFPNQTKCNIQIDISDTNPKQLVSHTVLKEDNGSLTQFYL